MTAPPLSNSELPTIVLVGLVADLMLNKHWLLATAESCTGGMIAAACTDLAGSSNWFERGLVTYSNEAKTEMLGVDAALIATHGAVSEPVARAMAQGAITHSKPKWRSPSPAWPARVAAALKNRWARSGSASWWMANSAVK